MYNITINLNDGTKIGPRQIDTTLESVELQEELNSDSSIKERFLLALAELPPVKVQGVSGKVTQGSEMIELNTYQKTIDFLGRSSG